VGIQPPADSMHYQKVDLSLGTDATGWMGTGMNDIWEIRQPLFNQAFKFKKKGTYNFTITQIMRDNPLPSVMSGRAKAAKGGVKVKIFKKPPASEAPSAHFNKTILYFAYYD